MKRPKINEKEAGGWPILKKNATSISRLVKMDGTQICKMNKFFYFISFKIALFIGRLKINSKEAGGGPFPFPSKFHFLQEALSASS